MGVKSVLVAMVLALWASLTHAQTYTAENHLDMRITGMLLAPGTEKQEDIITVDISVQNTPMLLRLGRVEELTDREKSQASKNDVLFKKVRFTGPEALMEHLLKPETVGKVLTIEGWLNARSRVFQVTAVSEGSKAIPTSKE